MPGGGQLKHSLNNVAQMHTHESRVSGRGRGTTAAACCRKCTLGMQTKKMDSSHLCVLPPVTHWEMLPYWIEGASNASLEQERKSRLPDVSVIFYFLQSFIETTGCDMGLGTVLTNSKTKETVPVVIMFKMWMVSERLRVYNNESEEQTPAKGTVTLSRDHNQWGMSHRITSLLIKLALCDICH